MRKSITQRALGSVSLNCAAVGARSWSNVGCVSVHSAERSDERFPWVTLDLGARFRMHTVQVWNRDACPAYSAHLCQNRLWAFALYAGDEPPPRSAPEQGAYPYNGPPCATVASGPHGRYVNVACAATGRYVTFQHLGSVDDDFVGVLNLCQIRVFGDLVPEASERAGSKQTRSAVACSKVLRGRRARAVCTTVVTVLGRFIVFVGSALGLLTCALLRRHWRRLRCRPDFRVAFFNDVLCLQQLVRCWRRHRSSSLAYNVV